MKTICCQLGAREHYAIPRALHASQSLHSMITDAWIRPDSVFTKLPFTPRGLIERYESALATANVSAFTNSLLRFEAKQTLLRRAGWSRIIARNGWFQNKALKALRDAAQDGLTLFTYSYAGLKLLRYAKERNWRTVLSQIDAGPVADEVVKSEYAKNCRFGMRQNSPPKAYWEAWREECTLADRIVVNSDWSSEALKQVGVPSGKLAVIPLAFDPTSEMQNFQRRYPAAFSAQRPMRVLFLGSITLEKGLAALLDAAKMVASEAIEFWMVGDATPGIPSEFLNSPRFRWFGKVNRSCVHEFYRDADTFLFPTLSDGFGMTQLEAQAWKLPVIASKFCGEVVNDDINGFRLPEVTGTAIATILMQCYRKPELLEALASASGIADKFSLDFLSKRLTSELSND